MKEVKDETKRKIAIFSDRKPISNQHTECLLGIYHAQLRKLLEKHEKAKHQVLKLEGQIEVLQKKMQRLQGGDANE